MTGSVERGYAGKSVFDWEALPALSPRYRDYARLLASVGINAIVWDNVNACGNGNQHILEHAYLLKLAPLAELFASYGNARIVNVGKSQSCMVSKLPMTWKQASSPSSRRASRLRRPWAASRPPTPSTRPSSRGM